MPVRFTVWVLPATLLLLSVMVTAAVRVPPAEGLKVMLMVQLLLAASEPAQLSLSRKSPTSAPVKEMLRVKVAFPVLFRITDCAELGLPTGWLPKVKLEAERLAKGPEPVPVRLTLCVLPATLLLLSVIANVAVRVPEAAGLNVTAIVQLAFAATGVLVEQVVPLDAMAKSLGLAPVNAMLPTVREALPVLDTVTDWDELVVPTFWLAKVKLVGATPAVGAVPVPLRVTVWGLPPALSVMLTLAERVPGAVGAKEMLIVQALPAVTGVPQLLV